MTEQATAPFIRNAWYQAAWSHEVGTNEVGADDETKPLARTIMNEEIVLFRDADGRAHALEDRCCHRATPLRLGEVVPEGLQCGYHGLIFGGDGACVFIPGQDSVPPQARVRSYPIVERQEFIWIWMGDPALADESKILDYPWNDDHANWPHKHGMYHVDCNYMLLIDNLMDLTHIPYIHRKTIGGGNRMGQVNARMDVHKTDTGCHYIRWMFGIVPPPTYCRAAGFAEDTLVDRWQDFEYFAPGSVVQWTGALEVGRGAEENRDQPGGFSLRLYHGATPETERSCHYFWTPANGYRQDEPEATQALYDEIAYTFTEDLDYLNAQQACLDADPDQLLVDIKSDRARILARRALDRMIRAEQQAVAAE
jgi:phenylpropionate dioxygenase-like ring-hydroxylating dioxygenase large terminal subunit